jgi:hypothetical protein
VLGSWKKKIKIEEFEKYVKDTHVKLHEVFPELWDNGMYQITVSKHIYHYRLMKIVFLFTESIHQYLGHCIRAIKRNGNRGLGQKREVSSKFISTHCDGFDSCCL